MGMLSGNITHIFFIKRIKHDYFQRSARCTRLIIAYLADKLISSNIGE